MGVVILLFILIIVLGALLGGNSFGSIIRIGCAGCINIIIGFVIIIALVVYLVYLSGENDDKQKNSEGKPSGAIHNKSAISGALSFNSAPYWVEKESNAVSLHQ